MRNVCMLHFCNGQWQVVCAVVWWHSTMLSFPAWVLSKFKKRSVNSCCSETDKMLSFIALTLPEWVNGFSASSWVTAKIAFKVRFGLKIKHKDHTWFSMTTVKYAYIYFKIKCTENQQEASKKAVNWPRIYACESKLHIETKASGKKMKQSRNGTKNIRFIFYSQSAVVITIGM